jgi:hypothetical protein
MVTIALINKVTVKIIIIIIITIITIITMPHRNGFEPKHT